MKRPQMDLIIKDLQKKMVFITGPRQVGKTHLALEISRTSQHAIYLNWDHFPDRAIIQNESWLPKTELLILDELHKMANWKNYLKGLYDTKPAHLKILITGSARLEIFRQTGDSLAGRFFRHRLHPFSLAELARTHHSPATSPNSGEVCGPGKETDENLDRLIQRGGFPEPFLAEQDTDANRWRLQYIDGLIRTDILDFEKIQDFRAIQLTLSLLRQRVGSPVSYSSLARDVHCSPNTIKNYIQILEGLFIIFRVSPFSRNIARSLLKEPKLYFFDTGMVQGDDGIKFENHVAGSLLKYIHALEDVQGRKMELHYLKTKEGKEVDFVLVEDGSPTQMIEVKQSVYQISSHLRYFHKKYDIPAMQLIRYLKHEEIWQGIERRRGLDYLKNLCI